MRKAIDADVFKVIRMLMVEYKKSPIGLDARNESDLLTQEPRQRCRGGTKESVFDISETK